MNEIISESIAPLHLAEWQAVQDRAKKLWTKTFLGERPTSKEVRKNLPNTHTITFLEWLAVAVLITLTIFTSYKVGALAVPFATESLNTLSAHTEIAPIVQHSFIVVTALLFMLLATPSVIYFKLLAHDPEVEAERRKTANTKMWGKLSLEYISPRLPSMVVYISVLWLVVISNELPGTPFEKFLPVVVEVALAALVGNILYKRQEFNKILWDALKEQTDPWDDRLKNFEMDTHYLRTVYQIMREVVPVIKRQDPMTGRYVKPNAWLANAEESVVFRILAGEYRRLTSGNQFANAVLSEGVEAPAETATETSRIALRFPPNNAKVWTPDSLLHDLKVRGIDPTKGYTEADLAKDYDSAYKPRSAWRGGARDRFLAGE